MKELNDFRKFIQENEIHEGTWALGSVAEMVKVMGKLEQIRKMGAAKGSVELENIDTALYNVFGDDSFQDAIDAAKGTDDDDRFNNFISDAQARAKELLDGEVEYRKERGETGMEFKPRFGLEENDAALDEVSNSIGIFKEIDMMIGSIKEQMDPDDAFDSLVSEFEAISGGTKLLHRALKNIALDNNLMEESLDEGLTQDILKKHPKKYKDEKAVKMAAAKLMKSPKFKGKGIGPVLQALLKGKE